jgi:putative membrane protein
MLLTLQSRMATASGNRASMAETYSRKSDLKVVGCGVLMGAADIVPGVSGGTVALVLGIYHRLVTAISHVDGTALRMVAQRRFKEAAEHVDLRFLITLAIGIGTGIGGLAFLMHYLLEHQLQYTFAVFSGLILGSGILVGRSIPEWNGLTVLSVVAGVAFASIIVGFESLQHPPDTHWYLFLCGVIGICAMILPGISGSFILLILGRYDDVTGLVRSMLKGDLSPETLFSVAVFGAGCVCGLLAFSRVLRWLLSRHTTVTLAVLCGFMIGSLRRIWPFKLDLTPHETKFKFKQFENYWPATFDGETLLTIGLGLAALAAVVSLEVISRSRRSSASERQG